MVCSALGDKERIVGQNRSGAAGIPSIVLDVPPESRLHPDPRPLLRTVEGIVTWLLLSIIKLCKREQSCGALLFTCFVECQLFFG
jgi:hypothetical protein